jgi:hypothetical protein
MRGTTSGQAYCMDTLIGWVKHVTSGHSCPAAQERSATRRVNLTFFLFGKFDLRPACETTTPVVILLCRTVNYEHVLSSRPTSRVTL